MAISVSCSNCGRVVYASEKEAGKTKPCPGCGYSLVVPEDPSLHTEKPTTKYCPQCGNRLRLVRQFHGKNVRCNKCGVVLSVSADPWRLSIVDIPSVISSDGRLEESQYLLPDDAPPSSAPRMDGQTVPSLRLSPRMPSIPDGNPPVQSPSDEPLAFLKSEAGLTRLDGTTKMRRDSVASKDFSEGPTNLTEARDYPAAPPVRISALRHPKEFAYFTIAAIISALAWLCLIPIVLMFLWLAIPIIIGLWITKQRYKAKMLGDSVKVSWNQYPEVFEIVEHHCEVLELAVPPAVFIVNSQGEVNAFAVKILKDKYVLLLSEFIDLLLAHDSTKELSSIIGHELGHHAAGHTAWWKNALLMPAKFIPFFGLTYSRACELTADRIGLYLCGDKDAACRGLMALACGSKVLSPKTNLQAFKDQESAMPWFFAFVNNLYSTHPRLTKRVAALEDAEQLAVP